MSAPHNFDVEAATPVAVFIEDKVRSGFYYCVQEIGEIEGLPFGENVPVYAFARIRADLWSSDGMARRVMRGFLRDYIDGMDINSERVYSRVIVQLAPYVDTRSFRLIVDDPRSSHDDAINQRALFDFCVWQVWQQVTDVLLAHYLKTGETP